MNKIIKRCLKHQKNINDSFETEKKYNSKVFTKASRQLENLITELNSSLILSESEPSKKELYFFEKHMKNLYSDYYFYNELSKLYIFTPLIPNLKQEYFISSTNKYQQYIWNFFAQYSKYCNNEIEIFTKETWTTIKTFPCDFMDSNNPQLFPSYFRAIERLLHFFEYKINSIYKTPLNESELVWQKSKSELATLIYALALTNCFGTKKIAYQQIANVFSKTFNIEITNISKIIAETKNRKNIDDNILSDMALKFKDYIDK